MALQELHLLKWTHIKWYLIAPEVIGWHPHPHCSMVGIGREGHRKQCFIFHYIHPSGLYYSSRYNGLLTISIIYYILYILLLPKLRNTPVFEEVYLQELFKAGKEVFHPQKADSLWHSQTGLVSVLGYLLWFVCKLTEGML